EDASGELRSSQILSVASNDAKILPRHVALKIKVLVEMERLQDLLYELETAEPWMFVHEMTILRKDSQGGGGSRKNPMLEVTLEVYGLLARVRQG
ncbi:MAG TPA: type II secretion system protein GspM, partial [Geminicoccaceae bacterium]|nr:type II secretion system protein GspM [Geminicoccaceae bacterium]